MKQENHLISGPAGDIEVAVKGHPTVQGFAFISHPHPLFGGTMEHKVVHTLQRVFYAAGWSTVRYNFRGVGHSAGVHADGLGECEDLQFLIQHLAPTGRIALAGFSFGCYVTSLALEQLQHAREVACLAYIGPATSRWAMAPVPPALHARTVVVHGEDDDVVPFATCLDWARPQNLPVTVVPQGGHFFHGQQHIVLHCVSQLLRIADLQ